MTFFRLLHVLALFWMMAGLGSVMVAVWRAWSTSDIDLRAMLLTEAQQNETRWLLSGMLATGLTGFAWAASENTNLVTTGWLLALELVYAVDVFIFLPLLGVGLRRVRLLALQAKKRGGDHAGAGGRDQRSPRSWRTRSTIASRSCSGP